MFLLISTPVHILLVDPSSGQTSTLRAVDGYYYGITYKQGTLVLTHSAGYLQYFNKEANPFQTSDHLLQPHQIEWVEDKVLVTNTGHNCLSVYDPYGNLCRDVYLNDITYDNKYEGKLGNHFNSVHKVDDQVFIVAHNYDKPSEVWELSWPELNVIDVKDTRTSWAHNLWLGEWGMVICNSKNGSLYEVSSGENIWQSNENGALTRGLAVSDDHIFVGYSSNTSREQRYWTDGGIWIVDRRTLKTIEKIPLPGSGEVQEIRLVGMPDVCHNDQVIPPDILPRIGKVSTLIALAYSLRKASPKFRRSFFPITTSVKGVQMTVRWKRSLKRSFLQ